MAVEQLPGRIREFTSYLNGLLGSLDPSGGWCGVFWQRDPDGMRACLEGRELPPWDVMEALLQDLAAAHGPRAAESETARARALHAAALAAHDARPGARDALGDRLDVMLREQRYAAERRAALSRAVATAPTREKAEALRLDLAWAEDDHTRAAARCAELRTRLEHLDRRTRAAASPGGTTGQDLPTTWATNSPTPTPTPAPAAGGATAPGPGMATRPGPASAPDTTTSAPTAGPGPASAPGTESAPGYAARRRSEAGRGFTSGSAAGWGSAAVSRSVPAEAAAGAGAGSGPESGSLPGASSPPAPDGERTSAAGSASPPAGESAPAAVKPRKRRRGGARFAGVVEDEGAPVVVPPAVVPPAAAEPGPSGAPPTARRTPRGARFAGATEAGEGRAGPPVQIAVDGAARQEVGRVVGTLGRLRAEGRTGEAHAVLVETAYWPAARFPLLAAEMQRAGLGADWATLLWETASLPADRLVAAADALAAAGRTEDGQQILRQGVVRPAEEIGQAVLALAAEERHREVTALLDAYVRMRTPEEAARSAAADPQRLVPLLLTAAQGVSDERYWDLLHALRVAGTTA
ncbi:hypothetical protein [Streptomyces sp. NPDC052012]|uniref:hypothetical protein n=1 Tax=Streptomyces sp. NPDC052012 TaxID=3155051 RepID=UPI00344F1D00